MPLTVNTTALTDGIVGQSYREGLSPNGGTPFYGWNIASGTLPDGLILDAATGIFSGITASQGIFPIEVEVRDNGNNIAGRDLTLNVIPAAAGKVTVILSGQC